MRCHFDVLHRSADAAKGWSALSGIAEDINRYYDYLTNEIKLQVTIHDTDERKFAKIILTPERLIKNRHTNPYCLFVKSNEEMFAQGCVAKQQQVFAKCAREKRDFFGMCFAGCCEFIYPLEACGRPIGFCSVGGFRSDEKTALSKLRHAAARFGADEEALRRMYYGSLSPKIPEKERIDLLVKPLCRMLELYCTVEFAPVNSQNFEQHIAFMTADYILIHYAEEITLGRISEVFNYSECYISRKFHEKYGLTVGEFTTKMRLGAAMSLLRDTRLGIFEIAARVGYADSNYFSAVFRKKLGMSPSEYRERYSGFAK